MTVDVLYFASLRDAAGCERERIARPVEGLAALYDALRLRHGFALPRDRVRVAVNGAFVAWGHVPGEGDEIVFVPPVSGG
jgi:molybdopterin synthase sulfur carrier subunit